MKTTFTIKDMTQSFYDSLDAMTPREAQVYLNANAYGSYAMYGLKCKVGNDSFRDKVELNQIIRSPTLKTTYKREARKGYFLITIESTK